MENIESYSVHARLEDGSITHMGGCEYKYRDDAEAYAEVLIDQPLEDTGVVAVTVYTYSGEVVMSMARSGGPIHNYVRENF